VLDVGTHGRDAVDYPDYAAAVGAAVREHRADRGIIFCSGVGASMPANRIPGIRAGLCHDTYSAHQGVEDDDMNLLVLGGRVVGCDLARDVVDAFLDARFTGEARHLRQLASVASFFVSRIDTSIDAALEVRLSKATDAREERRLQSLGGKVAIANAKLAYERYRELFSGPRWRALAERGAQTQRLPWAGTGTKSASHRDVLYVEELIGPDTVNTMPPPTLAASRDHGRPRASLAEDLDGACDVITNGQLAHLQRFALIREAARTEGFSAVLLLQITCDEPLDLPVPGQSYTFGVVKAAQARGDFQVLSERNRRALRVHLGAELQGALAALQAASRGALRSSRDRLECGMKTSRKTGSEEVGYGRQDDEGGGSPRIWQTAGDRGSRGAASRGRRGPGQDPGLRRLPHGPARGGRRLAGQAEAPLHPRPRGRRSRGRGGRRRRPRQGGRPRRHSLAPHGVRPL